MKLQLTHAVAFLLLSAFSIVGFITLFYYAIHGWGLRLQDARLVAIKETNILILGFELALFGAAAFWSTYLFITELSGKQHTRKRRKQK